MTSAVHHLWKLDTPVTALCINHNGDTVAASLGDGTVKIFPADDTTDAPKSIRAHDGISLCLRPDADAHAFLSGGDDGRVVILDPTVNEPTEIANHKNMWVDYVASSADGTHRAYTVGKRLFVLNDDARVKFDAPLPSSAGGLAFSPNGKRLAVSHYNGVSLFWLNAKETKPETLSWKGSHLDALWSPDGKVVMTSLQENALHGWQLADGKELRMQGYAAKVKSMGWTARGKFLATSGADQIICWPFSGGGPWGKPPLTLAGRDIAGSLAPLVTWVVPHPKDDMVAAGYGDGMIVLAPLDGRVEVMIYPPQSGEAQAITGLVWNAAGEALFAGTEAGTVISFTIDSVRGALVPTA